MTNSKAEEGGSSRFARGLARSQGPDWDYLATASFSDKWDSHWSNMLWRAFRRHIPDGASILEIGCGIGTDTINFARAGAQVTAVDLSVESLKIAERRATVFGLEDRVEFRFADAEKLSEFVPPEPFDLVYSFGVIHHTPNPDRVMAQVRDNFIMPGSTLKLMVYNRRSWKVMGVLLTEARGAFWRLQDAIARNSEAETGCPVTYTYTPGSARRLAGEGFRVDGIRAAHIFTYRVEDYVQYRYRKAWPFRAMPLFALRGLERLFGWHLCLTATAI